MACKRVYIRHGGKVIGGCRVKAPKGARKTRRRRRRRSRK